MATRLFALWCAGTAVLLVALEFHSPFPCPHIRDVNDMIASVGLLAVAGYCTFIALFMAFFVG